MYVKELDILLTIKSSKTRQQSYRSESFAMKTDILMSGSMVKKPHLIKKRVSNTMQHGELRSDRGIGSHPVLVSRSDVEEMIERGNPLFADQVECRCVPTSRSGCKNSERMDDRVLNAETHTPVLLMNHL